MSLILLYIMNSEPRKTQRIFGISAKNKYGYCILKKFRVSYRKGQRMTIIEVS